jgi:hypothetical protein
MTVTREEAVAQLEAQKKMHEEARMYYINKAITSTLERVFGYASNGHHSDVTYDLYDYHDDNVFDAQFKYDSFLFKIKARSGDRGGTVCKLYIRTKHRWKNVSDATHILYLLERGKLPESV